MNWARQWCAHLLALIAGAIAWLARKIAPRR